MTLMNDMLITAIFNPDITNTRGNSPPHILNTPNLVASTGALSAALNASASTRRVSDGAMMPSSHSRAVA
jgi:hypothetical protein